VRNGNQLEEEHPMERRRLGNSGFDIAPLVLGGNVFGWTIDEPTSFEVLDAFVAGGFNCIDTADAYSRWHPGNAGGESETTIGNWLSARGGRDRLVIATKVGAEMAPGKKGLSAARIVEGAEASLRRLKTDYIDLFQSHYEDPDTTAEETMEAYARLIQQGKVRAVGASNHSAAALRQALAASDRLGLPRYTTMQLELSLYERSKFTPELAEICRVEDLGVIVYFPLASGFLTGKYRTEADFGKSKRGGGMSKYLNARGLRILAALDEAAAAHSSKHAQIAIAWVSAQPGVTAPIASATSVGQLDELMQASRISLTSAELQAFDQAGAE
jgi:aryl-alcohol dehydrogenase-like predicted oxidoreductase